MLVKVQGSLEARIECFDAGIVVVGDAAGEDLAQHIGVQVQRDIGCPCRCATHSCIPWRIAAAHTYYPNAAQQQKDITGHPKSDCRKEPNHR